MTQEKACHYAKVLAQGLGKLFMWYAAAHAASCRSKDQRTAAKFSQR